MFYSIEMFREDQGPYSSGVTHNIKQLQRLHETNNLLQTEHAQLLESSQVLIQFLNCLLFGIYLVFWWLKGQK